MSDLSWLNPTPHAIAVYASRPLSLVATQHSLPSGRYPLLGPDFHRLDRTSLRLAHSFNHLVGADEERGRHGPTKGAASLPIDYEFELDRLLDRQIAGFGTLEDLVDVCRSTAEIVRNIRTIGEHPAVVRIFPLGVNRWQPAPRCQSDNLRPLIPEHSIINDDETLGASSERRLESGGDLCCSGDLYRLQPHAELAGGPFSTANLRGRCSSRIPKHGHAPHRRKSFSQELHPLATELFCKHGQSGDVAARMSEARSKAGRHRIKARRRNDRDRSRDIEGDLRDLVAAIGNNDVDGKLRQLGSHCW